MAIKVIAQRREMKLGKKILTALEATSCIK